MTPSISAVEIGSLTATSTDGSQFIGSASGIFFVNTFQRAFASSRVPVVFPEDTSSDEQFGPDSIETCILGHERHDHVHPDAETDIQPLPPSSRTYGVPSRPLGIPPSQELTKELIMVYFQEWHPLFPFILGRLSCKMWKHSILMIILRGPT